MKKYPPKKPRQKVVILRQIPPLAEEMLAPRFAVEVNRSGKILTREQLYRRVKGAAAIISLLTDKIDEPVLEAAGDNLRIVANFAVGFDNLDLEALGRRGVIATNTPGRLTESVAEHALALMLAVTRRIVEGDAFVRAQKYRQWEPLLFYGQPLLGRTVGVIGTGRIGGAFATLCHRGLRMRVLYSDIVKNVLIERELGGQRVGQKELLKRADVVSLHVPLTPATRHLIGRDEFNIMKKEAVIINTARGPVIDEAALVKALQAKKIFGAGLDVFEFEPKTSPYLLTMPRVVVTPHIGSATAEARDMMAQMAARNVIAVLSGQNPLNPVP